MKCYLKVFNFILLLSSLIYTNDVGILLSLARIKALSIDSNHVDSLLRLGVLHYGGSSIVENDDVDLDVCSNSLDSDPSPKNDHFGDQLQPNVLLAQKYFCNVIKNEPLCAEAWLV